LGVAWPGEDWSILGLLLFYLLIALVMVPVCRERAVAVPAGG